MKGKKARPIQSEHMGWQLYFNVAALLGICLFIIQADMYRLTFINDYFFCFTISCIGLIANLFTYKIYCKAHPGSTSFHSLFYNIISWGLGGASLVVILNYSILDSQTEYHPLQILQRGERSVEKGILRKRKPTVVISHLAVEKELLFDHSAKEKVDKADAVLIGIRQGLFGFEVIRSHGLISQKSGS